MTAGYWSTSGVVDAVKPQTQHACTAFLKYCVCVWLEPVLKTGFQFRIAPRAWYHRDCACQTISTSHVSSPRYAFSGGYVTSVVLSSGVTFTVKLLIDQLAFIRCLRCVKGACDRSGSTPPTHILTSSSDCVTWQRTRLPSLSARRRKNSDELNNYIRSTLALKTIFTHTLQL